MVFWMGKINYVFVFIISTGKQEKREERRREFAKFGSHTSLGLEASARSILIFLNDF